MIAKGRRKRLTARARRLEVAINLKPLWAKRDKIDDQLQRFEGLVTLEDGTLTTLDDLNKQIEEHERQRDILKGQRHQLRDEAERLGINDILVASGCRLEALAEQHDWLRRSSAKSLSWTAEVRHLEARLASENERFSQEWTGAGKIPPAITSDIVDQLTPQAKAIEATEHMLETAKNELEHFRTGEHQIRTQIESAMTGGDKLGLPMDVDGASDLVAQVAATSAGRRPARRGPRAGRRAAGTRSGPDRRASGSAGALQLAAGGVRDGLRVDGAVVLGAEIAIWANTAAGSRRLGSAGRCLRVAVQILRRGVGNRSARRLPSATRPSWPSK